MRTYTGHQWEDFSVMGDINHDPLFVYMIENLFADMEPELLTEYWANVIKTGLLSTEWKTFNDTYKSWWATLNKLLEIEIKCAEDYWKYLCEQYQAMIVLDDRELLDVLRV